MSHTRQPADEPTFQALLAQAGVTSHPLATLADAEGVLKTIAVADAAEAYFAKVKDPTALLEAIKAKLVNQANYAVWRQDVAAAWRRPKIKIAEQRS